jgi:hypothetical protein
MIGGTREGTSVSRDWMCRKDGLSWAKIYLARVE